MTDYQTNIISGVISNWVGDYLVGSNAVADVLLIQNGGVLSNGLGRIGCGLSSNNNARVVGGGIWQSEALYVGDQAPGNSLVVTGGAVLATGLTVGFNSAACDNLVELDSGSVVVTNATADAVLEVRSGVLILNSGVLQADKLVMTNACGLFVRNGGALIVGSVVLDPNLDADGDGLPNGWEQAHGLDALNSADASVDSDGDGFTNLQEFHAGTDPTNSISALRILDLSIQENDILITWLAGGGRTNVLQSAGTLCGVYFNTSPNIVIPDVGDVVTNYDDQGAATNGIHCFYRVSTRYSSAEGTNAPEMTITSPANGSYIFDSTLIVTGTIASDSGVSGVEVAGIPASSTNGYSNWVAEITGLAPGTNTLTVLAGDDAAPANVATNSLLVICIVGDFDGNGDGLPDVWQIRFFGSANALDALPSADPDADGVANFEEYLDGTDPTNDASALQRIPITATFPAGEDVRVYFTSDNGQYYVLERYDFVGHGWTTIVDHIPGNGGIQWVKDIDGAKGWIPPYRVRISSVNGSPPECGDNASVARCWTQLYFGHPTGLESDDSRPGDDPDGDGLTNCQELVFGTDPLNADTDGDGMPDGWEIAHSFNPLVIDAKLDIDGDGLTNHVSVINARDFGALADSNTDASASIRTLFASATNGSILYFPAGPTRTYFLTTTNSFESLSTLATIIATNLTVIADAGVEIYCADTNFIGSLFTLANCSNIVWQGPALRGPGHALSLTNTNCKGVAQTGVNVGLDWSANISDFMYRAWDATATDSTNLLQRFHDATWSYCGNAYAGIFGPKGGFWGGHGEHLQFERLRFESGGANGINLLGGVDLQPIDHVNVMDCYSHDLVYYSFDITSWNGPGGPRDVNDVHVNGFQIRNDNVSDFTYPGVAHGLGNAFGVNCIYPSKYRHCTFENISIIQVPTNGLQYGFTTPIDQPAFESVVFRNITVTGFYHDNGADSFLLGVGDRVPGATIYEGLHSVSNRNAGFYFQVGVANVLLRNCSAQYVAGNGVEYAATADKNILVGGCFTNNGYDVALGPSNVIYISGITTPLKIIGGKGSKVLPYSGR